MNLVRSVQSFTHYYRIKILSHRVYKVVLWQLISFSLAYVRFRFNKIKNSHLKLDLFLTLHISTTLYQHSPFILSSTEQLSFQIAPTPEDAGQHQRQTFLL